MKILWKIPKLRNELGNYMSSSPKPMETPRHGEAPVDFIREDDITKKERKKEKVEYFPIGR